WDGSGLQNRACSVRFAGGVPRPGPRSGPPCGVTAAGAISSPKARLIFLGVVQQPGHSVRSRGIVGASPTVQTDPVTVQFVVYPVSGCSSVVERVVRDDEAAGAIPVIQTVCVSRPYLKSQSTWLITE